MGKSTGKTLFSLAGFFIGAGGWGRTLFGVSSSVVGGIYGASLMSTIWSSTHLDTDTTYAFNTAQNTINNDAMIPIIYGTRKWAGGLQTWQYSSSDASTVKKHVVLCEGAITGVQGVTANCIPLGTQILFQIKNIAYSDATIHIYENDSPTDNDKRMVLYANGTTTNIALQHAIDLEDDNSNDFSCSTLKLAQHIEKLGNGWKVINNCGADVSPEDLFDISTVSCYNSAISIKYTGVTNCSYTVYTGSSTQTPPSNYSTVGSYKNTAYISAKLVASDDLAFSNPNICAVIKGRKVYDTRKLTTGYSENPAMCLRDYILNKRFGMGRWITSDMLDEDSFEEVADYCDEKITYIDAYNCTVTEPRYTLNLIINDKRKHIENIQDFLAAFGGFLVFTGDKISLRIEKQDSISYTFTDQDNCNIKAKSVKYEYSSLADTPNRYEITYFDPAQDWVGVKVFVDDTPDQYKRGNIIRKTVSISGCTSQGQALRLGELYKTINRLNAVTLTFSTGTMAMHLQPGDIISWTHRVVSGEPFRILQITENKGVWTIVAQQYNSSIYNDQLGSQITATNYVTVPNALTGVIPAPSNLVAEEYGWLNKDGTHISTINLTWGAVNYQFFRQYVINISADNTTWSTVGTPTTNSFTITGLELKKYYIRIYTQNTVGRYSSASTTSLTLVGKDVPPSDVPSMTVTQSGTNLIVSITEPSDPDINKYELRLGVSWGDSILVQQFIGTMITIVAPNNGTLTYWVKAIDNSGNYSTNATDAIVSIVGLTEKNILVTQTTYPDDWIISSMWKDSNNRLRISSLKTLGDYTYFSDIFGQELTLKDDAEIILPVIDLGETVIDSSCYWIDSNGNIRLKTTKTLGDYTYFSDIFGATYTYTTPSYITETFVSIDVTYVVSGSASVTTQYRTSLDGVTWGNWVSSTVSQFFGRYIQIRLLPVSNGGQVYISKCDVTIDVPDIEEDITNISIPASTTTVNLSKAFTEVEVVEVYTRDSTGLSTTNKISNVTTTGFDITLYDTDSNVIAGTLVKATIRGY